MSATVAFTHAYTWPLTYLPHGIRFQRFSIPRNIVFYISKNHSQTVWPKLFKSCKYFSQKQQFMMVNTLSNEGGTATLRKVALELDRIFTKIWVIGSFFNVSPYANFANIFPKLFYVDVKSLSFCYQHLSYNEFRFLVSSNKVQSFNFAWCYLRHGDGRWVKLGEIMEKLPTIQRFV